jgi:hypothetical protein
MTASAHIAVEEGRSVGKNVIEIAELDGEHG